MLYMKASESFQDWCHIKYCWTIGTVRIEDPARVGERMWADFENGNMNLDIQDWSVGLSMHDLITLEMRECQRRKLLKWRNGTL